MRWPGRRWTRRGARSLGAAASALWLVPLLGGLIAGETVEGDAAIESVGVIVLATANVAGVVIAFRRERLGGWLLLVTGSAFSLFGLATAGRYHALVMLVSGGPFVISGLLFLAAAAPPSTGPDERARRDPNPGAKTAC